MNSDTLQARFKKFGTVAIIAGLIGAVCCIIGLFFDPAQFFRSWLVAWLFFCGLTLGSLVIVMMHSLTGGAWGWAIRRFSEAGMTTLPLMALLFIPILLGMHFLYPWSLPASMEKWQHKHLYLNVPFFAARAAFYFIVLSVLAFLLRAAKLKTILSRLSASGLILYVLCMNLASTDWIMSLEPNWYSTIFVFIYVSVQFLSALGLMTCLAAVFGGNEPFASALTTKHYHDLGNMLLAFVIFWIYVSYSQFLIIWSGNLPKEISWYLHRSHGGWKEVAIFLGLFQFFIPFALLILRMVTKKRQRLGAVAAWIVVVNIVNVYWLVAPAFHPEGVRLHWLDLATLLTVGGAWTWLFFWLLVRRPVLPEPLEQEVSRA